MLLVASTGGHLLQLAKIAERLEVSADSTWVTFDSPQARSLLAGYADVRYVPYVAPRDARGVLRTTRALARIARAGDYVGALSTGAGVALSLAFLPRKMRRIYVESVSRVEGPSLTGRLLAFAPWVERRTQHAGWASRRWRHEFTLLDEYVVIPKQATARPEDPMSILVTLGTIHPYRFDAALDAVSRVLVPGDRVVWQVGCTTGRHLPGEVHESVSRVELRNLAALCDVVISHAGVGTAVDMLDQGIAPVLLPRRADRGEHVDDHQAQIGETLAERQLATVRLPEELTRADLFAAANSLVVSRRDLAATSSETQPVPGLQPLLKAVPGVA